MKFFIVPHGRQINFVIDERHDTAAAAIKAAEAFQREFGRKYDVVKVTTIWSTQPGFGMVTEAA